MTNFMHRISIYARSAQKTNFTPEKYTSNSEKNMLALYKIFLIPKL